MKQCLGCAHEGMLVTSRNGTITESTPAAEHILEIPSVELQGHNIREFCSTPDAYDDALRITERDTRSVNRSLILISG